MQLQSESIGKISAALTKFQAQMKGVKRTSENPFFKSSYADLAEVWDEIRGPLSLCELSVAQRSAADEHGVYLVTTLAHASGEWFMGSLKLTPAKPNDPQSLASAHTYARRYELMAITGLAPIDDDGERATSRTPQPTITQKHADDLLALARSKGIGASEVARTAGVSRLGQITLEAFSALWARLEAFQPTTDEPKSAPEQRPGLMALEAEALDKRNEAVYEKLIRGGVSADQIARYVESLPFAGDFAGVVEHLEVTLGQVKPSKLVAYFEGVVGKDK